MKDKPPRRDTGKYKRVMGIAGDRIFAVGERAFDWKRTAKRLFFYLRGEKRTFALIFSIVLIGNLLTLYIPYLMSWAIDQMVMGKDMPPIQNVLSLIAVLYISDALALAWQGILAAGASQRIIKGLRMALFEQLLKVPLQYFDQRSQGDLMSRFTHDIDNISTTLSTSITHFMNAFITIFGALAMMIFLSLPMTLIVVASLIFSVWMTRCIAAKTAGCFRKRAREMGELNAQIEESIAGFEVIRLFSAEEKLLSSFGELNQRLAQTSYKATVLSGLLMPLMNVINNFRMAALAFFGAYLAVKGEISIGVIAAFISYSRKFNRPLGEIASIFNLVQSALAGAERVFQVLDEPLEKDGDLILDKETIQGAIRFQKVSFAYPKGKKVLDQISLDVQAGKKIAIVGPTGAGKTTMIYLLAKFYEPDEGEILLDDIPLREIQRASLRGLFGMVPQQPCLFSATVRDNIRYPDFSLSQQAVEEAAKICGCHEFIRNLPQGYETKIGDSTCILSEGEKQLITIARAIIKEPKILILDEATSSVDTKTELQIQRTLLHLLKNRTGVIIAHRLSTIKEADIILVLENQRIAEMGSHEELLKNGGNYSKMYFSQFSDTPSYKYQDFLEENRSKTRKRTKIESVNQ